MTAPVFRRLLAALMLLGPIAVVGVGAMDRARVETRADEARQAFGVTGRGVIVALLDRGIDWKNADFRNADGSTRIAYIFDLTDDAGATQNPYGVGTVYSRDQINQALATGVPLHTRDAVGHGTTTAAIAAGNGRNSPGAKYRGIAPEATLLIVKLTSDGAPAHGSEPAEAGYWDPARLPVAMRFVRDKAAELGMPCVMLPNIGSIGGPTDGTSAISRLIDQTVGPGIPGLVFVQGTGDDGGRPNRAAGSVPAGGRARIELVKESPGAVYLDFWYSDQDRLDVVVHTPAGPSPELVSPSSNGTTTYLRHALFEYSHLGSNADFHEAQNGKRMIWIKLDGTPGAYAIELVGRVVTNGAFYGSLNGNPPAPTLPPFNRFLNFLHPSSISDAPTAHHAVVPNSYVVRTHWVDVNGVQRAAAAEGGVGELWHGSSIGPTMDGRMGVTVSAPADSVFTTYNPRSWWATFRSNLIGDGGGLYGRAAAVSAANPLVTGVIALMLEANPSLDAVEVKGILESTARSDAFTGPVPNPRFGFGKIDAFAAVREALRRRVGGGPPQPPQALTAAVAGSLVSLAWSAPGGGPAPTGYLLEAGAASGATQLTLPLGSTGFDVNAPDGTYFVRVRSVNLFGSSGASNEVRVVVGASPPGVTTNLRATVHASDVSFTWSAPTDGGALETYVLEAGSGPGLANIVRASIGAAPAFSVTNVPAGQYFVRVRAANRAGEGLASNEVVVAIDPPSPPGAPTLAPAVVTGSTVTLSWTSPAAGPPARSFLLLARTTPAGPAIVSLPVDGSILGVPGVPRGTYFVSIVALAGTAASAESNQIVVAVP